MEATVDEHQVETREGTGASEQALPPRSPGDDDEQQGRREEGSTSARGIDGGTEDIDKQSELSTAPTTAVEDEKDLPHTAPPVSHSLPAPPPESNDLPVIKLKPRRPRPPKKGILKPPSTAPAHPSRFSFRRDILQPLQYSRLAGGVVPVSSGLPSSVAVGEAMNSAAVTAGGWMGSALKRLGQAAGVGTEGMGAQQQQQQGAQAPIAPGRPIPPASSSNLPSETTATSSHSTTPASPIPTTSVTLPAPPPSQSLQPSLSVQSLKQVRFRMQSLAVVYPINGASSSSFSPNPSSPSSSSSSRPPPARHTTFFNDLKIGFQAGPPLAPAEEAETRKRVDQEWRTRIKMRTRAVENGSGGPTVEKGKERSKEGEEEESKGWTGAELERLYRECCRTREEPGIERLKRLLRENPSKPPKTLDLSRELLSHGAVEALSDLLSVDFGLKKLVLDGCGLDDESIKPLVHALLVSGCIPTISLANNKRIRQKGWKLLAIFVRKAKFLRYLDLSENNLDKKAVEWLVQSLVPCPPSASSTSTDDKLSPTLIDIDSPRPENRLVERTEDGETEERNDVDEEEEDQREMEPLFEVAPLLKEEEKDGQAGSVLSLRLENCGLRGAALEVLAQGIRVSSLKHISLRRNRINTASAVFLALMIRDFPLATELDVPHSSISPRSTSPNRPPSRPFESSNSVSIRQGYNRVPLVSVEDVDSPIDDRDAAIDRPTNIDAQAEREAWKADELRLRLKKQIAELPRIGSLLTLDVKGNDLRGGVSYISQVLKRNRTLKVLNLSENKIDMLGLVSVAEALRYNTCLETLDLSFNPCCGPQVEGMLSLRASMMVTPALKRLFLNSTGLTSEGAIAFAEFLPEARSLLHLDLTSNQIDISGVLALAVSVKLNTTIRCLDINIPPNDPDFSRLSQDILETCVRNTEYAQAEADGKGKKVTIAQSFKKSALAANLEERQKAEELEQQKKKEMREEGRTMFAAAEETRDVVKELLEVDQKAAQRGVIIAASEVVRDALVQLQLAEAQLAEAFAATRQGQQRERAEMLLMELASLLDLAKTLYDRPSSSSAAPSTNDSRLSNLDIPQSPAHPEEQPSSPSFSITSSDSEDSDDELPVEASALEASGAISKPELSHLSIPSSPDSTPPGSPSTSSRRSPIESSSRSMTLEEGEIFRKGLALGADQVLDEDEEEVASEQGNGTAIGLGLGDVSGEELKNELLEAKVPRSPRNSFSASSTSPSTIERETNVESSSSTAIQESSSLL
ncbi:uncharacterized protein JCM6883_000487 [Sporobolomyces salmoneus]|uniref:uncharacterized protein n=1 Tax=Sporobolomyces salmoneus TaxID=183962 RepID=UPI00316E0732